MDHISERGYVGDVHYVLVHKPIPIPEGMKIPDAKAAANKEWDKSKSLLAWDETRVQLQSAVVQRPKKTEKSIHFDNLRIFVI